MQRKLTLILKSDHPPLDKQFWHHPDAETRKNWSRIYESITSWFCSSNDFRKQYNCVIIINEFNIIFNGAELRYLAPNLRSVASLVTKAYNLASKLEQGQRKSSTPGIYVERGIDYILVEPVYQVLLGKNIADTVPSSGTISLLSYGGSEPLALPASNLPQAIVWINSYSA